MGISTIILKRSANLSKTYIVLSAFLILMSLAIMGLGYFLPPSPGEQLPFDIKIYFSILFIALASIAIIMISTPVLLLFVYDKNNGVLEYLLSTGMNQFDLFKSYLKAAIFLACAGLAIELTGYIVLNVYSGTDISLLALIPVLTIAMSLSVVAFTTVLMMAFSSLQKQRVGANQPLGIGLGVILIFPSMFLPAIFPSLAIIVVSLNAIINTALALFIFMLSGRLIKREKLLP